MKLRAFAALLLLASLTPCGALAQSEAPPLPDRNPARPGAPAPAKPLLPGEMPTVPWTEAEVEAAKNQCNVLLASETIDYQALAPIKEGLCGTPAPILVRSIGTDPKVVIDPPATVSCPVARELSDWLSDTVQPEAKALFGSTVVGLKNATSYSCRNRYGSATAPLSEHALANALDVSEFVLASGDRITVLDSWPKAVVSTPPVPLRPPSSPKQAPPGAAAPSADKAADHHAATVTRTKSAAEPSSAPPPAATVPPADPKSLFLKHVHDAACKEFGTVLGPEANAAHKSHFHFDMKARRGSSFCQ
jgi:hypothetical protein